MSQPSGSGALQIHIDGSSRGNPGQAGCGVVIRDAGGGILLEQGYLLDEMSNNAAEYNALIIALEEALVLKADSVNIHADSELLVRQMNGQYRVKHRTLKVLHERASHLAKAFRQFTLTHVRREENREADCLAQQASREGLKAARKLTKHPDPPKKVQDRLF